MSQTILNKIQDVENDLNSKQSDLNKQKILEKLQQKEMRISRKLKSLWPMQLIK